MIALEKIYARDGIVGAWRLAVDALAGFPRLAKFGARIQASAAARAAHEGIPIHDVLLKEAEIDVHLTGAVGSIPTEGSVLFLANHPGGYDTLLLFSFLEKVRPDFKIFSRFAVSQGAPLLARHVAPHMIMVGEKSARELNLNPAMYNAAQLGKGIRHLKKGGALALFPGPGKHKPIGLKGEIRDLPWINAFPAKLMLREPELPVVSLHIDMPMPSTILHLIDHAMSRTGQIEKSKRIESLRKIVWSHTPAYIHVSAPLKLSALPSSVRDEKKLLAYLYQKSNKPLDVRQ